MNDTAEDYLSRMTTPLLASKLLLNIVDDYINIESMPIEHNSQTEKDRNLSALLYALGLVQNDINTLRQQCYDDICRM